MFLADAFPEFGKARSPMPGEPVTCSVSLEFDTYEKVDEVYKRATALGASGEMGPTNSFWGTRFAVDPRSLRPPLAVERSAHREQFVGGEDQGRRGEKGGEEVDFAPS